jgi:hypothetical protein
MGCCCRRRLLPRTRKRRRQEHDHRKPHGLRNEDHDKVLCGGERRQESYEEKLVPAFERIDPLLEC